MTREHTIDLIDRAVVFTLGAIVFISFLLNEIDPP